METLQRTANRGSISTGEYEIDNSCRFDWNGTNTAGNGQSFMYDTSWTGTPTSTTTGCFSTWFKNSLSDSQQTYGVASFVNNYSSVNDRSYIMGDWGGEGNFVFGQKVSGSWNFRIVSNARYRDPAAWTHFFAVWDTSSSTEGERIRLYVNGERITSFQDEIYPSQNQECYIVSKEDFSVGRAYSSIYGNFTHGYMAETHFVDGTAYAPTTFGEFDEDSGIWKPKQVSVSYGNKGFYLDYKDASNLGNDVSGNNRDLTLSDIDSSHQATDTCTNNFATWNSLIGNGATKFTYAGGATKWKPSSGNWQTTTASMGFTKGKWYAEFKMDSNVTAGMVGVQQLENGTTYLGQYLGYYANTTSMGMGYYNADGKVYRNTGESAYGASYSSSVLVGVALEFKDDGTANMYVAKDGTWQNSADPANGTGGFGLNYGSAVDGFFTFASSLYQNPGYWQANFGGSTINSISSAASDENGYGTFEYAPPSGFYALCTKNLAEYG
jgi:hypothetical protein